MNEPINYHTIIHRPFNDISGISLLWSATCETYVISQHDADDEVPRTHVHILMIGCEHKKDWYQKKLLKEFPTMDGRKDFRFYTQTQKDKKPITRQGLWYLLKGEINSLKFQKNFSQEEVDEALKYFDPGQAKRGKNSKNSEISKNSKISQFSIIEEIRAELKLKTESATMDNNTFQHSYKNSYDDIMELILKKLDKYEIRTGMYDIERWFISVVRSDDSWKQKIKEKIFSKLQL